MKKLIALFCTVMVLITVGIVDFSAVMCPDIMGDVDRDQSVDVTDATAVQKHIADIEELTGACRYLADVDDDLRETIKDATAIQKYVAGLDGYYSVGEYFWQESDVEFYCSHLSGRAWVGEEVTFSTNGLGRYYRKEAYANSLYVNGELVAEGESNELTHIFTEPGIYDVKIEGYTSYDVEVGGVGYRYTWDYFEVTAPSTQDEVVIKNLECPKNPDSNMFYIPEGPFDFSVTAQGGSGQYEYLFMFDDVELCSYQINDTITINLADYTDLEDVRFYYGEHTVTVCVRDVLDNENTDIYEYNIYVQNYREPA